MTSIAPAWIPSGYGPAFVAPEFHPHNHHNHHQHHHHQVYPSGVRIGQPLQPLWGTSGGLPPIRAVVPRAGFEGAENVFYPGYGYMPKEFDKPTDGICGDGNKALFGDVMSLTGFPNRLKPNPRSNEFKRKLDRNMAPDASGPLLFGSGTPEKMDGTFVYFTCHSLRVLKESIGKLGDREPAINEIFDKAMKDGVKSPYTWAMMFKTRRYARAVVRKFGGQGHDVRLADEPELSYTNVYLANLPAEVAQQDIEKLMSNFGKVKSVKMLKDENGRGAGVAFANMENPAQAIKAIRAIHTQPIPGWSTIPYARLAYRFGKSARNARILRTIAENFPEPAQAAASEGKIDLQGVFRNPKEPAGLLSNTADLALLSWCQISRLEQRRTLDPTSTGNNNSSAKMSNTGNSTEFIIDSSSASGDHFAVSKSSRNSLQNSCSNNNSPDGDAGKKLISEDDFDDDENDEDCITMTEKFDSSIDKPYKDVAHQHRYDHIKHHRLTEKCSNRRDPFFVKNDWSHPVASSTHTSARTNNDESFASSIWPRDAGVQTELSPPVSFFDSEIGFLRTQLQFLSRFQSANDVSANDSGVSSMDDSSVASRHRE